MIYEIQKAQYEKVRSLFQGLDYHLTPQAVIDGICPGRIYVDDHKAPTSAFIFTAEGCFLIGDTDNDAFITDLRDMLRHISDNGDPAWEDEDSIELDISSQAWMSIASTLFSERAPLIERRRKYLCTETSVNWQELLPAEYTVHPIDQELIELFDVDSSERVENSLFQITEWIETNWGTFENYSRYAFGFCLVHEQHVVSWSVADCISGDRCEIGIYTLPGYRQRGLATITAAATVEYCFAQGLTSVGWHCHDTNVASWKTAEKVGFVKERDYLFYLYMFNKAEHLAETGWRCVQAKRYQEAVEAFQQVFVLTEGGPHYWYHSAAMAHAGLGDSSTALIYLRKVIEQDWPHPDFTEHCEEFAVLHDSPEWNEILTRMRQ